MNSSSAYKPRSVQFPEILRKDTGPGAIIYLGINVTVMLVRPTRN